MATPFAVRLGKIFISSVELNVGKSKEMWALVPFSFKMMLIG